MRKARVWSVGVLMALSACSGGDDDDGGVGPGTPVFTTLDVSPATVSVAPLGTQTLTATAKDQNGATMAGLTVTYTSSDQSKATVTSPAGVVTGVAVGTATITATGVVGAVTKTKTVAVTVAAPGQTASVTATNGNQFEPKDVTVTVGGSVTWTFESNHNVTFSTAGSPANIGSRASGTEARTFPTAGTYSYICTIHGQGMSGSVKVQ
jgi:plastocyanin